MLNSPDHWRPNGFEWKSEASELSARLRRRLSGDDFDRTLFDDMLDLYFVGMVTAVRTSAMKIIARKIVAAQVDIASQPDELRRGAILTYGVATF